MEIGERVAGAAWNTRSVPHRRGHLSLTEQRAERLPAFSATRRLENRRVPETAFLYPAFRASIHIIRKSCRTQELSLRSAGAMLGNRFVGYCERTTG
jgi:hypothetical protein